jgi:LysM repeat protein
MANKKISELTPLNATPDANDILPLNDTSVGTTFSVRVSELQAATQALASNLTDISTIAQANGTMIASNGTNFVSLGTIDGTGLSAIRADLGLGTAATTASGDYATAAQGTLADSALQSVSAGALSDFDFDDNAILGFSASTNPQTGTTYTVAATDNGKVVVLDNALAITVDIDTGLPVGFNCSFIQKGAGQVTFAGTATLNNRQSHTKINAQFGVASIVAYDTDTYILAGDTAS